MKMPRGRRGVREMLAHTCYALWLLHAALYPPCALRRLHSEGREAQGELGIVAHRTGEGCVTWVLCACTVLTGALISGLLPQRASRRTLRFCKSMRKSTAALGVGCGLLAPAPDVSALLLAIALTDPLDWWYRCTQ